MFSRFILFLCLSLVFALSKGQNTIYTSPRSQALGGITSCLNDVWSAGNNPAGMLLVPGFELGAGYANRFMLPELSTQAVALLTPVGKGRLGSMVTHFGNSAFHENSFSVSYARQLYNWLLAGIHLKGSEMGITTNTQSLYAVNGDAGFMILPAEGICIGLMAKNITQADYHGEYEIEIPTSVALGIAYSEPAKYLLASQVFWSGEHSLRLLFGVEYFPVETLALRIGIQTLHGANYSFGMGSQLKNFRFDVGFAQHQVLGYSSSLALTFKLGKDV